MSRWLILALCLALGAALTAACAGGESATSPPPTQQATEPPAADATEPASRAVSATSEPTQPYIEVGHKAGQQAPDFTLTTAAGEDLTLDSLQGRPVILYFFATW